MTEREYFERACSRFWSRVDIHGSNECWPWLLPPHDPFGYGGFWFEGRTHASHRMAWLLTHGRIPKGLCVLHRCDNPPCCNPAHLFLGTKSDNALDRHRKGRTSTGHVIPVEHRRIGELNPNTHLNEDDVKRLRQAAGNGVPTVLLAEQFQVHRATVRRIVRGSSWRYL